MSKHHPHVCVKYFTIPDTRKAREISGAARSDVFFRLLNLYSRLPTQEVQSIIMTLPVGRPRVDFLPATGYNQSNANPAEVAAMENSCVGILTFHCSDNFGAMLQAYGLKHFLRRSGIPASIIPYAPPYMTGRHWLIPYIPWGLRKFWKYVDNVAYSLRAHLPQKHAFTLRRTNMKRFRTEYLLDPGQRAIYFPAGLKKLPYHCYITGSDQIWNPAITFGLRPEYFGFFASRPGDRVIAYAASLGGTSLPPQYDRDFSRLIQRLDAISLREPEAAGYVRRFYAGEVTAAVDPVFLPDREAWTAIERPPAQRNYILTTRTEQNPAMEDYLRSLARDTGLPVVRLGTLEDTSGPAEFLGYIHHADYVVTNSFHAAAFSIIFEKKFLAFAHSCFNSRVENILRLHGLEDRLCHGGSAADIDAPVDWAAVRGRRAAAVEESSNFLLKHITGDGL